MNTAPQQNQEKRKVWIKKNGWLFLAIFGFLVSILPFINIIVNIGNNNSPFIVLFFLLFAALCSYLWINQLIILLVPPRNDSTRIKTLVSVLLTILLVTVIYGFAYHFTKRRPAYNEAFWITMQKVCGGEGNEGAAIYNNSSGIHKVVPSEQFGDLWLYTMMPYDWLPATLEETELVICVSPEKTVLIQDCQYIPMGDYARYQNERDISLRAARTGEVIAQIKIYGSNPPECPATLSIQHGHGAGGDVNSGEVIRWLRSFIEK
jgi:hypothetical protein